MSEPVNTIIQGSVEPEPATGRRAAFLRVFNWTSVALLFWLCFGLVVSSHAVKLPTTSTWEWTGLTAYMVRQNLVSGFLVLLALAATEALLPARLSRGARWTALTLSVAAAAAASTTIRLALSRYPMMNAREAWSWFTVVVVHWTLLGLLAAALIAALRRQAEARRRLTQDEIERECLAAKALEARLTALQAQIEPHFLFNTLANVRRLYQVDPALGRRMLGSLLDYLRAALPSMRRSEALLAEELELVRAYLTVLQHRLGDRLRFQVGCSAEVSDATIPPLMLATLVENAVRHGLAPLPEGGMIEVSADADRGQVVIRVSDDGAGFKAESGTGVGLANTRARLSARYGAAASLELRGNEPRGVVAEVRLPLNVLSKAA